VTLELTQRDEALALEVPAPSTPEVLTPTSIDDRIINTLCNSSRPLSISELRAQYPTRKATLYARLTQLTTTGQFVRCAQGCRLAANNQVPASS
jgi:hypothetical protein